MSQLHLIGYASGLGGADPNCGKGPIFLQQSHLLNKEYVWEKMIQVKKAPLQLEDAIAELCKELAVEVIRLMRENKKFVVIGGDHTSAIGTWSGVANEVRQQGKEIGLIWIDAHMDSHTPQTSLTQRIHGMPLAALMGYGYSSLSEILGFKPKIKPQNICLIGVRSFEEGEARFLREQNVKIYYMKDVEKIGFQQVLQQAVQHVSKSTVGYGISLDLDSIDPIEAPGVDVPAPFGLHCDDLYAGLCSIIEDNKKAKDKHDAFSRFLGMEVVEFDPTRDIAQKTEKIVAKVLEIVHGA